jgi:hypothetical protein
MKRLMLVALATGLLSTTAFATPLFNQASSIVPPSMTTPARIVCEENGVCFRAPGRRPTERWIYGDGSFYGPYEGPRYYGSPARRYKWSFLTPWL